MHPETTTRPPVGMPWHGVTFAAAFPRFFRGFRTFHGRAARAEFWWWGLWWLIIGQAVQIPWAIGIITFRPAPVDAADSAMLDDALQSFNPFPVWGYLLRTLPPVAQIGLVLYVVVILVVAVPWAAIAVRRLHDSNRSGWWVLLFLMPIGNLALLVLLAQPSDERGRRFDRPAASVSS